MTRPNGISTNYSYDNLSRLLSVLHQAGVSTIDGATYTVDAAGNRTAKTDQRAGVTSSYSYDPLYELTQVVQGANTTESYSYDQVGNRLSSLGVSPYSYNVSNQLTAKPGVSYTYDNNGNTTSKTDSTGTTNYAWDFENRLTSVTLPGSGGTVTFAYDPFGRRIKKATSSTTSIFAYDGDNLIEETNSSGAAVARYEDTQNIDEPLAMLRSATTSYYHADGLGSVTSLSNAAGSLAQTYTFDSFGKQTGSSGLLTNPFQYTARESDTETGLYYYRARYYDASAGRFLSEDPIGLIGGVNKYQYVRNQPLILTDSTGLCPGGLDRKTALAQCVKELFGVTLKDFTPSAKGQNGLFSGETSDGKPISVTNDVNTFTVQNLNEIFYHSPQPPQGRGDIHGLTLSGRAVTSWLWGFIPLSFRNFDLSTNYSGSDLLLADLLTTQIHELGHSLAQLLGLAPKGTEDPYASKLEDCVIRKMLGGPQN